MSNVEALIQDGRAKIEKAHDEVIRILKVGENPRMSIPANFDRDTDLILVAALEVAREALTVLEGLVSAPTNDDPAQLHDAIRETVIRWEDCGGNIEHMLKESLSGFRLPVLPVPVYEYGVKAPVSDKSYDIVPARSEQQARGMLEGTRRSKLMRRVPASEWELVPVGVDKP